MNCKESREKISTMIWDKSQDNMDEIMTSHIKMCKSCEKFFIRYNQDVRNIFSGLRDQTNPELYELVKFRINDSKSKNNNSSIQRPVIKLAISTIGAAAAILTGVWAGQSIIASTYNEKEAYQTEMFKQISNNDISSRMIDYYNDENSEQP